jgi:hypothetical protein
LRDMGAKLDVFADCLTEWLIVPQAGVIRP